MNELISPNEFQKFTELELQFAQLWESLYPDIDLIAQYPFGRHRADFCNPEAKVVIECQGGTWASGMGHSSGSGIERDCKKFCKLANLGYLVFPLTCKMIEQEWIDIIAATIKQRLKYNA